MSISPDEVRNGECPALELELEADDEAPSLARAAVIGFCEDRGLSPSAIATLVLLTSELVTNAVIHPDVRPPAVIGLHLRVSPDAIRIAVSDRGTGFTPRPRDPARLEGGYGLYLVEKESRRWGVERQPHTTVWFELAPSGA